MKGPKTGRLLGAGMCCHSSCCYQVVVKAPCIVSLLSAGLVCCFVSYNSCLIRPQPELPEFPMLLNVECFLTVALEQHNERNVQINEEERTYCVGN